MAALAPARAQFGSIFGGPPPRPPADVPNRAPSNLPPAEPLPAPMSLPPARRPGAEIETQPLAPPPGSLAPPANRPPIASPGVAPNTTAIPPPSSQATPGLPPGQRQPRGVPQQVIPQQAAPQPAPETPPSDELVVQPPEQKIANPTAVFSGLDKITGRTISFDVAINETVQFGALQVTPRVCYSRPPTETPRTDAFVAVDEVTLQGEVRRIFTGWMFASSPGLHAVEHPIYDVWLTECKGGTPAVAVDVPAPAKPVAPASQAAKPKPAPPPPRRTTPAPNFLSPFR